MVCFHRKKSSSFCMEKHTCCYRRSTLDQIIGIYVESTHTWPSMPVGNSCFIVSLTSIDIKLCSALSEAFIVAVVGLFSFSLATYRMALSVSLPLMIMRYLDKCSSPSHITVSVHSSWITIISFHTSDICPHVSYAQYHMKHVKRMIKAKRRGWTFPFWVVFQGMPHSYFWL